MKHVPYLPRNSVPIQFCYSLITLISHLTHCPALLHQPCCSLSSAFHLSCHHPITVLSEPFATSLCDPAISDTLYHSSTLPCHPVPSPSPPPYPITPITPLSPLYHPWEAAGHSPGRGASPEQPTKELMSEEALSVHASQTMAASPRRASPQATRRDTRLEVYRS